MKHELWELQQMQSLPLQAKITMTQRRIIEWVEHWRSLGEDVYYSWSGGKDSTVLRHMVLMLYPDMKGVFVDTGLEYPELKEFVKKHENVVILHPEKPFWQVIRDYGYPIISKEVSECVDNARKHLTYKRERERVPYAQHFRKLFGLGEYSSKSSKDSRNSEKEGFP